MTEEHETKIEEIPKTSILNRLHLENRPKALGTLFFGILGAIIYVVASLIPMPYMMISILKFGLLLGVVIVALTGAIRGPVAGFLAGYLGEIFYGLFVYNVVVAMTFHAAAYGILGLITGLVTYDFTNGKSLAKLSVLSIVGFLFTVLLSVVVGIVIEGYSVMAAIAFSMLPLITLGLPTLLFLTPVMARLWYGFMQKMKAIASAEIESSE
ncbi:MAG: ECF transporter S component [Candidatus Thorarchaeota archaeon]